MPKVDFKREMDAYKAKRNEFRIVEVPAMQYLMVDGVGDPNTSPQFADAIAAIYPVAYALKFMSKNERDQDYVVMPLEGQWWADDASVFTRDRDKSRWHWTLMNMIPDWLTREDFQIAIEKVRARHAALNLDNLRLETLNEGLCVQTLHVGPFDDEGPVLETMHRTVIPESDLEMTGKHHEIYLSDFRKVEPTKLRTILRQPVTRKTDHR